MIFITIKKTRQKCLVQLNQQSFTPPNDLIDLHPLDTS